MKLEVGMYVRTENGIIEKINKIYDRHATDNIVVWLNGYGDGKSVFIDDFEEIKFQSINSRGFIKKEPSFNIIDLIEVGDYVNGYKVVKIDDLTCYDNRIGSKYIEIDFNVENDYEHWCEDTILQNPNINSIVTKEQFESMSYKVD